MKFFNPYCKRILLLFFLLLMINSFPQSTWERFYGLPGRGEMTYSLISAYDYGFIYAILVYYQNSNKYGTWILKTDINGIPLWSKFLFSLNYSFNINNISEDMYGNIFITGKTCELDPSGDVMIMKLNFCGEKIWCKYMHFPQINYGWRVRYVSEDTIILLTRYASNDYLNERNQLWWLDSSGNILNTIQLVSHHNHPYIDGAGIYDVLITVDKGYLFPGMCYFPLDTNNLQGWWVLQHLLLKVDSSGTEQWLMPDSLNLSRKGALYNAIECYDNYYIVGYGRDGDIYWPYLSKVDPTGHVIFEKVMHTDTLFSFIIGIYNVNNDFIQFGELCYGQSDPLFTGVFLTDTLGNLLLDIQNKNGSPNIGAFSNSIDNKYLVLGYAPYDYTSFTELDAWAMKVNENLEYDSLYSFPFVYDSLCPFPIPTDTVDCDCDLITGYGEPVPVAEWYRMEIYPNPAGEKVRIRLNDLTGQEKMELKKVILFDLFGRRVMEKDFMAETSLETGRLNAGIYLVVVEQSGEVLARGKLVVF